LASNRPRNRVWHAWDRYATAFARLRGEVTIAIVGKYTGLKDAYKSLIERFTRAASPIASGSILN